ncbi:hypothetical protein ACUR5C_07925 [Aliikangiella sp. IMCC44653]
MDNNSEGFTLYGKDSSGHPISINCQHGVVNDICKIYTYHSNGNSMFYFYHMKHLHNWKEIDESASKLFDSWYVAT